MRISKKFYYLAIGLLALCGIAGVPGFSQTITGAVTGTVTDASGAVIPGAKVTASALKTGVKTTTTTNAAGVYSIRFLTIGDYDVRVEAAGFSPQSLGPFALEAGQVAKFDAKLAVAGSTQNVSVSGDLAPLLNTENSELAT